MTSQPHRSSGLYRGYPWRLRWRFLLAHGVRVAGWRLLEWANRHAA